MSNPLNAAGIIARLQYPTPRDRLGLRAVKQTEAISPLKEPVPWGSGGGTSREASSRIVCPSGKSPTCMQDENTQ